MFILLQFEHSSCTSVSFTCFTSWESEVGQNQEGKYKLVCFAKTFLVVGLAGVQTAALIQTPSLWPSTLGSAVITPF